MPAFSRLTEVAKALLVAENDINQYLLWETLTLDMRSRYLKLAYAAVENLRNPITAQTARVLVRYPAMTKAMVRQVWKEMVDQILEERDF